MPITPLYQQQALPAEMELFHTALSCVACFIINDKPYRQSVTNSSNDKLNMLVVLCRLGSINVIQYDAVSLIDKAGDCSCPTAQYNHVANANRLKWFRFPENRGQPLADTSHIFAAAHDVVVGFVMALYVWELSLCEVKRTSPYWSMVNVSANKLVVQIQSLYRMSTRTANHLYDSFCVRLRTVRRCNILPPHFFQLFMKCQKQFV